MESGEHLAAHFFLFFAEDYRAASSVPGKKCEFYGREAVSGVTGASGAIYWCLDCGMEHGRILGELCASERPDLMRRSKEARAAFLDWLGKVVGVMI